MKQLKIGIDFKISPELNFVDEFLKSFSVCFSLFHAVTWNYGHLKEKNPIGGQKIENK